MKSIAAIALLAALTVAEVPSNSYLPPPPNRGYPQAQVPQVVAARALEGQEQFAHGEHVQHGAAGIGANIPNGFVRNGVQSHGAHGNHAHGAQGRFNDEQGYEQNTVSFARNGLEDVNSAASYNFGYMVHDYQAGTDFGHHEVRQQARARGEYHVVLPDGRKQTVSYEADERGFKPQISYEDSEDGRSGYDGNANNFRANNGFNGYDNNGFHGNGNGFHGDGHHGNDDNGGHGNVRSNGN